MTNTVKLIPVSDSSKDLLPEYGSLYSACFDVKADISNRVIKVISKSNIKSKIEMSPDATFILEPGARALIPTGFIFELPKYHSMRLYSRSGTGWKKGICLMNSEGVIDWDYPNETFVMLLNTSSIPFSVQHGDRIAQGELVSMNFCDFELGSSSDLFANTSTRDGGFGSTGD